MRKRSRTLVRLLVIATAASSLAGTASAQVLKGTFTLPYEVRWGQAVLPAGQYFITLDRVSRPALVTTVTGRAVALVRAGIVDNAQMHQGNALLITQGETGRVVRSFNWRDGGRNLVYKPITRAEQHLPAEARHKEIVAVSMASK